MVESEVKEYRAYVSARLSALSPLLHNYALGDFSESIPIPEREDEFTELLVGLRLMVDDIREMIQEKEDTITRLEKMERALRASEQWLSTTLRSIGDAVIATDVRGCVTLMNPVAEELTGWREAEAMSQPVADVFCIVNEQTGEQVESPVGRVLQEGVLVGLANHTALIARDGTTRPIDDSGAPIRDGQGSITGAVLVFRDITQRRQAEQELFLKNIVFESSIAANSIAGTDGVITHVNSAFLKLWDYETKEAAIGNSVASFFVNEEDAIPVIEALNETGEWAGEFLARRRNGSTFISRGFATVVRNEQGEQIGYQSANLDVTAEKRAEEKVRQTLAELERTNADLERFNHLAVGRELRMIELKRQVNQLSGQLGQEPSYDLSILDR